MLHSIAILQNDHWEYNEIRNGNQEDGPEAFIEIFLEKQRESKLWTNLFHKLFILCTIIDNNNSKSQITKICKCLYHILFQKITYILHI